MARANSVLQLATLFLLCVFGNYSVNCRESGKRQSVRLRARSRVFFLLVGIRAVSQRSYDDVWWRRAIHSAWTPRWRRQRPRRWERQRQRGWWRRWREPPTHATGERCWAHRTVLSKTNYPDWCTSTCINGSEACFCPRTSLVINPCNMGCTNWLINPVVAD